MRKKIIALALAVVILVGGIVGGTIAYLADVDSDVNVMTTGNVYIDQLEYERVKDANGNFIVLDTTNVSPNYGYTKSYKLQEFTQGKKAYPAVYQDGVEKYDEFQQIWNQVGAPGSNDLFDDSMKNVVDKFVFVKNTGKSDAYFRTWIAVEAPEGSADLIHLNTTTNNRFDWETVGAKIIDGQRYVIYLVTYNQILVPGEVSRPSLLQVFLDPMATNKDSEAFGDTWEILVFSQATQVEGFASADNALDTAFGTNDPWTNEDGSELISLVGANDVAKLNDAAASGKEVVFVEDIVASADVTAPYLNKTVVAQNGGVIDGNGNTLSSTTGGDNYVVMTSGGTIKNLTIDAGFRGIMIMSPTEDVIIDNVNIGGDVCYPINTGEGNGTANVIVTNSTLCGWTSIGDAAVKSASFTNCEFGQGEYYTDVIGRLFKPYVNTTVTNCSFIDNFYLDLSALVAGAKIVITDCTVDGVALDASVCSTDPAEEATATFFVELPSWATSLADCVVFN